MTSILHGISHGTFSAYQPEDRPDLQVAGVLFGRRADGADFYEVRASFDPSAVILWADADGVICGFHSSEIAATPLLLDREVIEIRDVGFDPASVMRKTLDLATGVFTDPAPAVRVVSRFQARRALKDAGLLATVEAMIAASGNDLLQDAWAEAAEFRTDSAFIQAIAADLSLTPEQVGALFDAAEMIVV